MVATVARVSTKLEESRRLLVERVAASRHLSKSARLRDLLVYLCEHSAEGDVHEQEVGHKGFTPRCCASAWSNTSGAKARRNW